MTIDTDAVGLEQRSLQLVQVLKSNANNGSVGLRRLASAVVS